MQRDKTCEQDIWTTFVWQSNSAANINQDSFVWWKAVLLLLCSHWRLNWQLSDSSLLDRHSQCKEATYLGKIYERCLYDGESNLLPTSFKIPFVWWEAVWLLSYSPWHSIWQLTDSSSIGQIFSMQIWRMSFDSAEKNRPIRYSIHYRSITFI